MIGFLIKLLFFTISDKLFVLREIFRSAPDIRRRITNFSLYDNILYDSLSEDDEILSKFFLNYNIIINWIYCNYTWGWLDHETEKWTGAVGKVNID